MYKVNLTQAHFPAQHEDDYHERTISGVLHEQATQRPNAMALRD